MPTATNRGDKVEMKACPTPSACRFHGECLSRPPADQVPDMRERDPTPEELADPRFEAIWQVIKGWDVRAPWQGSGYSGATGTHVAVILAAPQSVPAASEVGEMRRTMTLLFYDSGDQQRRLEALADAFETEGRVSVVNYARAAKDIREAAAALKASGEE